MTATELSIFLLTTFDSEGKETERLVSAATAHAVKVNKASAGDVARVMQAGGKIESAE